MKFRKLPILISVLLLCTACATTSIDTRIQVLDSFWGTDVHITNVASFINSSDLLEVQITGVNEESDYLKLEYRIEWLDNNGFLIPSKLTQWTEFPAFEKTDFRVKMIAPKTNATDFKILIREVNN